MKVTQRFRALFSEVRSVESKRNTPLLLSIATLIAVATHGYSVLIEHRTNVVKAEVLQRKESARAEDARERSVSDGQALLALAQRENLFVDSFLQRPITYRNLTLPASEANQVLDRTLNGGIDSLVSVQQFRLAVAKPGQDLWGGLIEQDSVVLTLVGEQYFRATRQ